jgi:hypothetical protein
MGKMVGAGAEIFDKLEPEPEPSRTKMDRLRNTGYQCVRALFVHVLLTASRHFYYRYLIYVIYRFLATKEFRLQNFVDVNGTGIKGTVSRKNWRDIGIGS